VADTPRPKEEIDADLEGQRIQARATIILTGIRWAGLVALGVVGYLIVNTLAGRSTLASVGISIRAIGSVYVSQAAAWLFGISGIGYGLRQRRLRHTNIQRLGPGVRERESAIDPKRTSSQLTSRGRTRPQDEV